MVDPKAQAKKDSLRDVEINLKAAPTMPPYPYGLQNWGNAYQPHPLAGRALLGGAKIQSGNKISKGRNKGKTRRKWHPYVQAVKLRSEVMEKEFTLLATRSCVRTIEKCGGLDQYLLGEKPARLKELGPFGWKLRWLVVNSQPMRAQFTHELRKLKMPHATSFEEALTIPDIMSQLLRSQSVAWQKLKDKGERFERVVKEQWERKDKTEYNVKESATLKKVDPALLSLDSMLEALRVEQNAGS